MRGTAFGFDLSPDIAWDAATLAAESKERNTRRIQIAAAAAVVARSFRARLHVRPDTNLTNFQARDFKC
jgi:hypothetical protein